MRSLHLYDSKIYAMIISRVDTGKRNSMYETLRNGLKLPDNLNMDLSRKGEYTVIELTMNVSSSNIGVAEISVELLKMKFEDLSQYSRKVVDLVGGFVDPGYKPHLFILMTNGSKDDQWLKTPSDMTFLYKEKKTEQSEIFQTNISYLNRLISGRGEVIVNSIKNGKVDASLFLLGRGESAQGRSFPRKMVLDVNISDIGKRAAYGEEPISVSGSSPYEATTDMDKRMYQIKQNYLVNLLSFKSKLLELFLIQSRFMDVEETEFNKVSERGKYLKDEIFQLQNGINEHMKKYIPTGSVKKRKEQDFLDKQTFEKEKELLTAASVRFSLVSEVEHQIMRQTSNLHEMEQTAREAIKTLSLQIEDMAMDGMSYSLGEMILKGMELNKRELSTLMAELSHSRDILSSTIEVLRTFIDTRQREVSEDMSRLMNLLFLVFACIGLADALGNFVILFIEYGFLSNDPTLEEVFRFGSLGMLLTLFPLLTASIFLYLFFKRK